jgi:DNA mismatch repair protein MutH
MTLLDDVHKLQETNRHLRDEVDGLKKLVTTQEEQINGKSGLYAAVQALAAEVHGLRRAMYVVGGIIVTASIGFAFSVLQLTGGG